MIEVSETTLENGLPLARLAMPGTRAVTLLVAFDAGARTEREEENGIAHFLEHLVFKGGEQYPTYREVMHTAERLGAQLNAFTTHDSVAFHVTCRAEAAMDAAELLTDFVARPHVGAAELERERGVVLQEIARTADQPAALASMLLDRAAHGDHPLGRPVLGPPEHLRTFSRAQVLDFMERRWAPSRGGAFVAGDVSKVDIPRLAELLGRFPARPEPAAAERAPRFERRVTVAERETNQSHLRLHWHVPIDPADLPARAALAVYTTLLGGSMGSRLFEEIREERGLCYSISAYGYAHADTTSLTISAGLESAKAGEAYERMLEIVAELSADGTRPQEVERARAYAAGALVLSFERTMTVASRTAAGRIAFGELRSPDETVAALDAVTEADVREIARTISGPPSVGCVGPHREAEFAA
ncbi:MAG: M16 family metallopeptidase [Thermoleophilaceae bacterium]